MKIKTAARTVIITEDNKTAIIEVRNGEYYKIPGGGVEEGEMIEQAAVREALEEAGCNIKIIRKIGEQEFVDPNPEYHIIHRSICFLAQVMGKPGEPNFDDWEKGNKFKLFWVSFAEAENFFNSANPQEPIGREINKRDLGFLLKAKSIIEI
ncbi:MAG: NUDIX domain-containing protein [Candidatus Buchananbacteria bacterium]